VNEITHVKKATATSPRKRKSSARSERASPRRRSSSGTSRTLVEPIVDDLESSTAMSEVSLVVEVTAKPGPAQRRSGHGSTDLESDAVVPGGSPAAEKNVVVEITEDLAVCYDTHVASSVAVDDDVGINHGMMSMMPEISCQSTSSSTEPRHLAATADDRALSLFLDESLRDVMSMGFADDGSGGGAERGWMPTTGITTMDCLGGRPLLQLGGEASEDASSDIDVELRRIVASVAHNHNNDDVNSVTSDDCAGCVIPDVPSLPAASLDLTPAVPPSISAVQSVDDESIAALDSESATSTTNVPSRVDPPSVYVTVDSTSHVPVSSCDGYSDNVTSSTLNVVASTCSGTQSNRTTSGPLVIVSASCSETPSTSTTCGSSTSAAANDSEERETTTREERSQQEDHVEGCDGAQSISCIVSDSAAGSGCCQKPQPSDAATTPSTDSCRAEERENSAKSSGEVGQSDPVPQLRSDAVSTVELSSRPEAVRENSDDMTVPAASVATGSSTNISCTLNSTSSPSTCTSSCCQMSVVYTSSSNGCSSQPDTARFTQHSIGTSGSTTPITATLRGRSSKNLELSPKKDSLKKDSLSVNCIKPSVNSDTSTAKSQSSVSADVSGSSERASVATQTNTDLLGRYFHRRTKPVSSFLGGAKHSRGSGGCGAGLKERLSSRMMSKSTVNSSSSSGSSAYHFGSTSSSCAVSTASPAVAGGPVLLTSGHQVAPVIMPAIGPMNGKTTFLITVPANFTLPASVGAVIGPAVGGATVPVSLGLSKASMAAISGSRTGVGVGSTSRLTATVSSTATALVLGQSALGTPLQLLVAAATALTTSSSTVALSRAPQTSLSRQQQFGVVTMVTASSVSSGVQSSDLCRDEVVATSLSSSLVRRADSSPSQAAMTDDHGSSVRVGKSLTNCAVASTGGTSTTPLQVSVRTSTSTSSTAVVLPMASPRSGGLLAVATASSTVAVSSSSVMTTTTTVPRCSPSSAVSPTSSGARHATIASLPRVAMRRRSGASDVVIHPTSSSSSLGSTSVTLLNGVGHGHTPRAAMPASSAIHHDGGGKSPIGGTTPTVVAKQPVHGQGAPASIIRAILERNLSCPLSYSIDEALTRQHIAPPTPSPTDDHVNGYYASVLGSTSTIQPSSTISQVYEERGRASVDPVLSRPASVCQMSSSAAVVDDCVAASRSDRQNTVARKRTVNSAHHPVSAKYRRFTTDASSTAQQLSVRNTNPETDSTHASSRCSAASESGTRSTVVSSVDSSAVGACGLSLPVGTSGSQQTGSNANGVSTATYHNRQRQQTDGASSTASTLERSSTSDRVQVERTTSGHTRVALPKKVYAYLGSAGAARENAAAAAVAAVSDSPLQPTSTAASTTVAAAQQNNVPASGQATGRRAGSDDGPIRHLRLMCSGLAASAGGLELRTHTA